MCLWCRRPTFDPWVGNIPWKIIPLECCVGFSLQHHGSVITLCVCVCVCNESKLYMYLLHLDPPPNPTPPGHHRMPGWAPCVIYQLPRSYLFYTRQCVCVSATFSIHPMHCVHKCIVYVCVSVPSTQIGSSVPFSWIPYICFNILYLVFSDLPHSV